MITLVSLVIGFLILVFALLDLKWKSIPSIFLTGALFVICAVNFVNIEFGVLAFILAYLLFEAKFIDGIADLKVIAMVGLCITTMWGFFAYVGLLMAFSVAIKVYIHAKNPEQEEFAFIPIIFLVYIVLLAIQYFGGVI